MLEAVTLLLYQGVKPLHRFYRAVGPSFAGHIPLLMLGIGSELVYAFYFLGQFPLLRYYRRDTDLGGISQHSHSGALAFVVANSLLFLLFALAWWRVADGRHGGTLWLILAFGGLFGLTMSFVYPITAIDIYSYIAESRIMVHYHHNPIFTPPASYSGDPVMALSGGWQQYGSPYGPLGMVVDAIPAVVTGGLLANLLVLKLLFSAMALGAAYLVYRILDHLQPDYALGGALLVAWNPLILVEVSANGHNDIAMMLLALVGCLAMVRQRLMLGPLFLVLSALVKYVTLLLLPLFLIYALGRQPTRRKQVTYVATTTLWSLAIAAVSYAPFWHGTETLKNLTLQNERYADSLSIVLSHLVSGVTLDQAAFLGSLLFIPLFLAAVWLASGNVEDLFGGCFLATFGLLALATTNVKSWYALWPVLLATTVPRFAERVTAVLLSCGRTLAVAFPAYLLIWLGADKAGSQALSNSLSYIVTFVPATIALVAFALGAVWGQNGRRRTGNPLDGR